MDIPIEITLRDVAPYEEAAEAAVRRHAEKLGRFYTQIMRCHVVVEPPAKHRQKGAHFGVRIELSLPGKPVVVNRTRHMRRSHEDLNAVIRDAFNAAKRRLEDHARRQRGDVKAHDAGPHGRVTRLYPSESYGFIETADGREVYFHRNSVLEDGFVRLMVGSEVRFVEEPGEDGPQASTVRAVGKHHIPG